MHLTVVGVHIHPEAAKCHECGQAARVNVVITDDDGYDSPVFSLCSECYLLVNIGFDPEAVLRTILDQ